MILSSDARSSILLISYSKFFKLIQEKEWLRFKPWTIPSLQEFKMLRFHICQCLSSNCNRFGKCNWCNTDISYSKWTRTFCQCKLSRNLVFKQWRVWLCPKLFQKLTRSTDCKVSDHHLKLCLSPFSKETATRFCVSFLKKVKLISRFINKRILKKFNTKKTYCKTEHFVTLSILAIHQYLQITKLMTSTSLSLKGRNQWLKKLVKIELFYTPRRKYWIRRNLWRKYWLKKETAKTKLPQTQKNARILLNFSCSILKTSLWVHFKSRIR